MELPAGILPDDSNVEFFAKPGVFGKVYFMQYGQTKSFSELPERYIPSLYEECFLDKVAVKAMELMGVKREYMVEQYNYCNRGRLDPVPDIVSGTNRKTREFVDCGRRGKCVGEGKVCKPFVIDGSKITHRERECMVLNANNKKRKEIMKEMGFKTINAVNSLMQRIRLKTGCKDRADMALKAKEWGLI